MQVILPFQGNLLSTDRKPIARRAPRIVEPSGVRLTGVVKALLAFPELFDVAIRVDRRRRLFRAVVLDPKCRAGVFVDRGTHPHVD